MRWYVHCCTYLLHSVLYPELQHRQGGCLACWCCKIDPSSGWDMHQFILCTRRSGGTAHEGGGCDQSIGSTVYDAIVRSWLWLTATRSSLLGHFSNCCKWLIIDPTFCGSKFSTGRLLAIEDLTLPYLWLSSGEWRF